MNNPYAVLDGRASWALIRGDSLRQLPRFPPGCVDHVITDPPYRRALYEGFRTNLRDRETQLNSRGKRFMSKAFTDLASERIGALEDILPVCAPEFMRLSKRWLVVFHDAESGHLWREPFGESFIRSGIWVKPNPTPQISGDRPGQGFEMATIAHRPGKKRWNGGGKPAVWRHSVIQSNFTERRGNPHPCPKPLSLMRELVELFTDPGDVVLDPFAGSGSTGVACLELGRRFIGIERDATYARTAIRRLRAVSGRPYRRVA